jgi:hypothetical protein
MTLSARTRERRQWAARTAHIVVGLALADQRQGVIADAILDHGGMRNPLVLGEVVEILARRVAGQHPGMTPIDADAAAAALGGRQNDAYDRQLADAWRPNNRKDPDQ